MYCKYSSYYQRDSNSTMKQNPPHELSREGLSYSCLHFYFSLPNAMECSMSPGCSEQQHLHGEATRTRMTSAAQGSNSCGHLDRPTMGRLWWDHAAAWGVALPFLIIPGFHPVTRLGLPGLDLFMQGYRQIQNWDWGEASLPCPRRTALATRGMAGSHRCWMTSWKDISLPRGTWQCMCLPKETGEHGQGLFSSQTAQELSKVLFPPVLIFTSFKSNTNFRIIITLLWFQHLSLHLSIRFLKRQCCTD